MSFNIFTSKKKTNHKKNSIEVLRDMDKSASSQEIAEVFFGLKKSPEEQKASEFSALRKEFTIFRSEVHKQENVVPKEILALTDEIRAEIEALKKANKAVEAQAEETEKTVLSMRPEKGGIYHTRFLETLLNLIKSLRAKVGEARTWMAVMHTKKAKRGSLFMTRAKKKGVEYSLSPELQTSRGVM